MHPLTLICLCLLISASHLRGDNAPFIQRDTCPQQVLFSNPSFEDTIIMTSNTPVKWRGCLNSPDTQPDPTAIANQPPPSDGNSYLGLATIAFANPYDEAVSQILPEDLLAGVEYEFSIDLAFPNAEGYDTPANILIYIGNDVCDPGQLIFTSTDIDTAWKTEIVNFIPDENYSTVSIVTNDQQDPGFNFGYTYLDNIQSVACDTVSSTAYQPTSGDLLVYPNPNHGGVLQVDWEGKVIANKISVYDAFGKLVKEYDTQGNPQNSFNTSIYQSGWYLLVVRKDDWVLARERVLILR